MASPLFFQKTQDWLTQQWVILRGQKINHENHSWLMGPFGDVNENSEDFIKKIAEKEGLIIDKSSRSQCLIPSIEKLHLSDQELAQLSQEVILFYKNTQAYHFHFSVVWNPFFKQLGKLVNTLFSNRIEQLNIPTDLDQNNEIVESEIITLIDPKTQQVKYTFWLRSLKSSGKLIYLGMYDMCTLPKGKVCIKEVFPLPNGNATVIMTPTVGKQGELILNASGKKFDDAGFYFLLKDAKGNYWSKYVRSFRNELVINFNSSHLEVEQVLTLWLKKVLTFIYSIHLKE